MKFKNPDSTSKDMLMTEAPSWEALSSVSELTEALMAWQTLDQLIHPSHYGTNVIVWIVKKVYSCICAYLTLYFVASLLGSSKASLQEPSENAGELDQQSRD